MSAAQRCYRTQPAISAQVRQSELELNAPLFERFGSRISLTTAGKIFAHCAGQIREQRRQRPGPDAARRAVSAANEAICIYVLPRVFADYVKLLPQPGATGSCGPCRWRRSRWCGGWG